MDILGIIDALGSTTWVTIATLCASAFAGIGLRNYSNRHSDSIQSRRVRNGEIESYNSHHLDPS